MLKPFQPARDGRACQMRRLAEWIERCAALVEEMPDDEADRAFRETMGPLWREFFERTPETRSAAGAVAALRALILSHETDDGARQVLRSVLRHLEAST